MLGGTLKKIFFKKSNKEEKPDKAQELAEKLRKKSQELSEGLINKIEDVKKDLHEMKQKYDNLLETNYKLGLKHIENGNIAEAIFRFRFIKKFWPEHYDSYYHLAYCLVLNKKPTEAKKILEELMSKNPQHPQGRELLDLINSDIAENFGAQDL